MTLSERMPERIYLDNAATSWPKPPAVYEIIDRYQRVLGAPAGRAAYRQATEVERLISLARKGVADLIGADDSRNVIFTHNGTDSLNLAIHGLLRPGDHVVATTCEHNSVLRPLSEQASKRGVEVSFIRPNVEGVVDPAEIGKALRQNTRLVTLVHVSNVTGAIQPIAEVGRLLADHPCRFLVDAAQSLGHLPVHVVDQGIDLLAAPGHKGLLGPLGTGILYIQPSVVEELAAVRQGGTGTDSVLTSQVDTLPEKYEAGNLNVPGILGIGAGVQFLQDQGFEELHAREQQLSSRLATGLAGIPQVRVIGPVASSQRCCVQSFTLEGFDPQEVASMLDDAFSIQVRAGLHCAPLMHEHLGTSPSGTIRLSWGPFTTEEQIDRTIDGLAELAAATF
jgi:cysteine desulfurase/selenocysteine lyase